MALPNTMLNMATIRQTVCAQVPRIRSGLKQ